MILPIYLYGAEVLREAAAEADLSERERITGLVNDMKETLKSADGCGLAAPQVGVSLRVLIVDGDVVAENYDYLKGFRRTMINPVVLEESPETRDYSEGCLSVPGIYADVRRPAKIKVEYYDENFEKHVEEFKLCGVVGVPAYLPCHLVLVDVLRKNPFEDFHGIVSLGCSESLDQNAPYRLKFRSFLDSVRFHDAGDQHHEAHLEVACMCPSGCALSASLSVFLLAFAVYYGAYGKSQKASDRAAQDPAEAAAQPFSVFHFNDNFYQTFGQTYA